jgi:hypothetical protein
MNLNGLTTHGILLAQARRHGEQSEVLACFSARALVGNDLAEHPQTAPHRPVR